MPRHSALFLALTLLAGALYPAKSMSSQDQQVNDEDASLYIERAERLLKGLLGEEVMADDDDMTLLPGNRNFLPTRRAIDVNLAKGRPTSQSSTAYGGNSGRAVDGNRSPIWPHGSCTHTWGQTSPWWYVDLGKSVNVGRVAIVNRRDCCSERITPFDVHVGYNTDVASNPRCGGPHNFPAAATEHVVDCRGMTGRYVGIRLPGNKRFLTLCEVEVYAAVNLALSKPVVQSGTAHGGVASRATDGCKQTNFGYQCCTHTPAQSNPWLRVDLGKQVSVQSVVITNRQDSCCKERINPYTIHVGNNPSVESNPRCGGHQVIPAGASEDAVYCNGLTGRYVGIRLPGNGRTLTVCELEVYGGTP